MKAVPQHKRLFLAIVIILLTGMHARAQERTHRGLYLSMQFGPAFGSVNGFDPAGERLTISGTGFGFDLLLGGTLTENLVLHGTLSSKLKSAPTINGLKCSECIAFDETFIGAGLTYYLKHNFLISGSIGSGSFTLSNDFSNINYAFWDSSLPEYCTEPYTTFTTREGFSYQLKAGKEWWVDARWAMGILFEYSSTRVSEPFKDKHTSPWTSNRFNVRISITKHGKKNRDR
jgi:hypothetical protein